jgi:hypothetical protein
MIRISESLTSSRLDDELVLLDGKTGKYFGLNAVGSRIFQLLRELGDEEAVLATLVEEYSAPPDRLKSDLAAFIDALRARGFVADDAP